VSKALTGSKASLKINGVKVAFVGGVNVQIDDTLTPIDVIDQLETAEFAETGHSATISCTLFKIDANSLIELGIRTTNIKDILTQPELTIEIYNAAEDKVEASVSGVKLESSSGSVDARGVWQGSWSFRGRIGSIN